MEPEEKFTCKIASRNWMPFQCVCLVMQIYECGIDFYVRLQRSASGQLFGRNKHILFSKVSRFVLSSLGCCAVLGAVHGWHVCKPRCCWEGGQTIQTSYSYRSLGQLKTYGLRRLRLRDDEVSNKSEKSCQNDHAIFCPKSFCPRPLPSQAAWQPTWKHPAQPQGAMLGLFLKTRSRGTTSGTLGEKHAALDRRCKRGGYFGGRNSYWRGRNPLSTGI